jgi:prevent-host-death family protein
MRTVQLQEAKAKFSALVDAVEGGDRVTVTRHGKPVAVLVSADEWERVAVRAPSFAEFLLSFPGESGDLPERDTTPLRDREF